MSEFISGKEALIALANGEDVEYMDTSNTFKSLGWSNAFGLETNLFFSDRFKFRLKPSTITINGIEVPKPNYFVDAPRDYDGRGEINIGGTCLLYKSRKDHDAVVAALRSVFGAKEPVRRMSSDSE